MVIALNKIDVDNANPDRAKQQLMALGLVPEEYGGDSVLVPVSALKGQGIDDLDDRRHRPGIGVHACAAVGRQRPRHVAHQAATGDVGQAAQRRPRRGERVAQGKGIEGVDARGRQEHVAQRREQVIRLVRRHARRRGADGDRAQQDRRR